MDQTIMQVFIKDAIRTEAPVEGLVVTPSELRQLHAAIGITTEAGELIDAYKKAIFYRKELDLTNVKEEAADLIWYLALLFDEIGTDFETEAARVIAKLKKRYPEKFTTEHATNRDLDAEREILEGSHNG